MRRAQESDALKAEIRARYARGERHRDIAEALGISVPYSSKVCRDGFLSRADGEPARRVPTAKQRAKRKAVEQKAAARSELRRRVVALYAAGRTHAEIGRELGMNESTSAKIAREHGLAKKLGTTPRKSTT